MDRAVPAWEGSWRRSICQKEQRKKRKVLSVDKHRGRGRERKGLEKSCYPCSDPLTLRKLGVTLGRHMPQGMHFFVLSSRHPTRLLPLPNLQIQKLRLRKGPKARKGQNQDSSSRVQLSATMLYDLPDLQTGRREVSGFRWGKQR